MLHTLPAMCIGGAAGAGAAPTIASVNNTEEQAISCGAATWQRRVAWTLDFNNDGGFEIQIRDDANGGGLVVTGLLTSVGVYYPITVPASSGDTAFTGSFHNAQYTVELVRKVDSVVVDSMQTNLATVETGPPC